jgi:carbohydrate diacid regulator
LSELGIAAFIGIADEDTKVDLAKYLLSPLDEEVELLTTLETFFSENCCPSSTAKQLSIHRNTLSYRLDKIASLTGLEPRKFDDAVQMRLSLLLRSLQLQPINLSTNAKPTNGKQKPGSKHSH